jgi:hypothetical protein
MSLRSNQLGMIPRDASRTRKRIWLIGLLLSLVLPGSAFAHGGGPGLDYDPCAQQIGDDFIHMAAYQPELNWSQEYCSTIPTGGKTLFVFDLVGSEMRHVPVSIKLVENRATTLVSIAAAQHLAGVINFSVPLKPGHSYQAVVSVGDGPTSQTLTFPIRVNAWWNAFALPGLLALAIVSSCVYYGLRIRQKNLILLRKADTRIRTVSRV